MANNGDIRSVILGENGEALRSVTWSAPAGSSPFFGWMGDEGFTSVRISEIQCVFPNPQRRDQYVMTLHGVQLLINVEDAYRLMRRIGWTQPQGEHRA
jgi:hypothetical protein